MFILIPNLIFSTSKTLSFHQNLVFFYTAPPQPHYLIGLGYKNGVIKANLLAQKKKYQNTTKQPNQPQGRRWCVSFLFKQTNKQTKTQKIVFAAKQKRQKKFVFHPLQAHPHAQSRQHQKEKEHGAHKTFMRGIIILLIIIIIIRVVVYYSSFFFAFLFCVSRCCSRIDRLRGGFRFLALRSH